MVVRFDPDRSVSRTAPILRQIFGLQQVAAPPVLRDALDVEFEPEPEPELEPSSSGGGGGRSGGGFGGFFGASPLLGPLGSSKIGIATPSPAPPIGAGGGGGGCGGGGGGGGAVDILGACELYNGLYKFLPALKVELIACLCFALKSPPLIVELWCVQKRHRF